MTSEFDPDEVDPAMLAKLRRCDHCRTPFLQGRADHRFCCIPCKNNWHVEERRAAVADYRRRQALSLEEQCDAENEEIQQALGVDWSEEPAPAKRRA